MMSSFLKKIEIGFRKFLLRTLRFFSRRNGNPPVAVDYNACKFLFIRQDRIGDVLVSTPLFHALKESYPAAVIDVLLSRNNHMVLDHAPYVRKRWMYTKRFFSGLALVRGIQKEKYDFVIDLMDNPSATSTVLMLLARGRWNVGLEKENAYVYDIIVPMLSRRQTHIVERLGEMLNVFGVSSKEADLRIRYATAPDSDNSVDEFLGRGTKRLIGVNISAGSDSRFWGIAKYQGLLSHLRKHFSSFSVVLLHKSSDRDRAREIMRPFPEILQPPDLSFDQFAACIKRLDFLITPDTSAVHLAAAFHVPSVILYVQANKDLRIWEPYKTECEAIVTEMADLSAIDVPQVFEAFKRLAARASSARNPQRSGIPERV